MKRVFISFDYDNDKELRATLAGEADKPDSPFQMTDCSVHERLDNNWRKEVRQQIRGADLAIVICGEHTHQAKGVEAELTIAREEGKPYHLLRGRPNKKCNKPANARNIDTIHEWSWDNLEELINKTP